MNFSKSYLEIFRDIKTPKLEGGLDNPQNHQVYYDYCELRNSAKDLLDLS